MHLTCKCCEVNYLLHAASVLGEVVPLRAGKAAFEAAQCSKCHRFNNDGGSTGPDLTTLGNRFVQAWEFYAITGTLFVTLAFPGFIYRYLVRRRG